MPAMPLDALAPDQRAVVQLVLQRGRSYEQIAELLKISEDAVRARAHAGLSALAPDVELPADKLARISDFLLGQQEGKPRQATRRLLRENEAAATWATFVRASLEDVGPVPELPAAAKGRTAAAEAAADEAGPAGAVTEVDPPEDADEDVPEAEPPALAARPRPAEAEPPAPAARPRPRPRTRPVGATEPEGAKAASSSRLGGALLIGGGVIAIVVVVLVLFVFGGDDGGDDPEPASATATPTASATPQAVGTIDLSGANGSKGRGVMTLYTSQGQLAFTLEGTNVPQNRQNEAYAVWFTTPGGGSQRLGFAQPVGKNGQLGTTGPRQEDLDKFPQWLSRYKQVVVSRERDGKAKKPGPIVLRGNLPSS
jgi:hypothetical protein